MWHWGTVPVRGCCCCVRAVHGDARVLLFSRRPLHDYRIVGGGWPPPSTNCVIMLGSSAIETRNRRQQKGQSIPCVTKKQQPTSKRKSRRPHVACLFALIAPRGAHEWFRPWACAQVGCCVWWWWWWWSHHLRRVVSLAVLVFRCCTFATVGEDWETEMLLLPLCVGGLAGAAPAARLSHCATLRLGGEEGKSKSKSKSLSCSLPVLTLL